ncbi:MAG TPA: ATP-binding protein [Nitrospiria bacterium]|jgi:signal transduction histidine kinase
MLRADPEQTLFGHIPTRLIISLVVLLALVLTIFLVLGIQHEKNIVEDLIKSTEIPPEGFSGLGKFREDFIKITLILFLLGGIGVSVIVTYQNYRETKKALEQVKSLARNILESIPNGILTLDRKGRITALNPLAEQILSVKPISTLGQSYKIFFPGNDPIRTILSEALEKDQFVQDQKIDYVLPTNPNATISVTTSFLKDNLQKNLGIVLLLKDISKLSILEQRLQVSEKLSALHTLSAGIAHEIRNPLSALDLNLQLLEEEVFKKKSLTDITRKYFNILHTEIYRLKEISDNFMRFSKPLQLQIKDVNLPNVLLHLKNLLEHEATEKKIKMDLHVPEDLPLVKGDETEISQAFLNIIMNAFQAMEGGGTLKIGAHRVENMKEPWIEVIFSDSGNGIPKASVLRLFEPFFTTKKEGTGLGLSIVYRIVEDHHGSLHLKSQEGSGTTATIRLPCFQGSK